MQSYSELRAFRHMYHIDGNPCQTHANRAVNGTFQAPVTKEGISALDFDNKGIYLASVTKSGCLTVHDFEILYCQSTEPSLRLEEDEAKHVLHLSVAQQLDFVRWNRANQDEVVCTSMKRNEVLVFDISYISSTPSEVLKTKPRPGILGSNFQKGLSDIAFTSCEDSRVLAADTDGVIHIWDRRTSTVPYLELTTNSRGSLNSIQLNAEDQIIFGAGRHGVIYAWDLRGGRTSSFFKGSKEGSRPPLTSLNLSSMLEKIGPLKEQSAIVSKEIHSINLDPGCPHQLAFHLDDGWSGVLDVHNLEVTHIHCPPPAWLNDSVDSDLSFLRKPSWLPTNSIYVVGSSTDSGIHILDFYPDSSSPSHVDYDENANRLSGVKDHQAMQNRFIDLSEGVTACAVHPLNSTIIAGTKHSSLLMVSQTHKSC
ncbi:uncharacterized protein LOC126789434 [Argentina anserina]|uniref:uncharacterized protein LOC126789434 n=1 Tax=Argentina anserina TaxID=57926 RepID=UPI0021767F66|nr:uncharacterized protein LOC126789434 [Potentilla anserina]